MKPQTTFETHQRTIQQREQDAAYFIGSACISDAQRILADLALMKFEGVTSREWLALDQSRTAAAVRIGKAIASDGYEDEA